MSNWELYYELEEYRESLFKWIRNMETNGKNRIEKGYLNDAQIDDLKKTLKSKNKVIEEYNRVKREITRLKASPVSFDKRKVA